MPFDEQIAIRFISAVPAGRWTTYGEVADVGGDHAPMAAFRVGQWLAASHGTIDNYWRVIDVEGRVPDAFAGGGLGPRTADQARDLLRREGVRLDALGRADPDQRFLAWHWVDDADAAKVAFALTVEQHSVDLPADLSALQALAASTSAPAQAIAVNLAILEQAPEDVQALNRLGRAQREIGQIKDAATTFGRVLVIDPKDPVARKHVLELAKKLRAG